MNMEKNISLLELTVDEYKDIVRAIDPGGVDKDEDYWNAVRNKLQTEGEWTKAGAEHILNLARDYGSFALRNALALAIALDVEDGLLGV